MSDLGWDNKQVGVGRVVGGRRVGGWEVGGRWVRAAGRWYALSASAVAVEGPVQHVAQPAVLLPDTQLVFM